MQPRNGHNTLHMGYARSAFAGFTWQTVLKILSNAVVLLKIMILARLLSPTDFGVFSLVMIALGLSESITQTGVNVTILQSKHSVEYFLDTAWVVAIIRGLVISLLMALMGVALAWFYHQPDLLYLVALTALTPMIKGFINPAIVSLHKNMAFFQDSVYRLSLLLVETVLAVAIAWWWHSVVALIFAILGAAVFEVLISFTFFKLRPQFRYLHSRGEEILNNARWLSLSSILAYLNDNLDNLLIGRLAGTFNLGLYQNSYALSHEVNYELAKSVHHSTLPVYSRLATEPPRLRRAFRRTLSVGMLLMGMVSLPLFFWPEYAVQIVLGEQWLGAVPLVPWLVAAGWLQGVMMLCYTVLIARRALPVMNLHTALVVGTMVVGILILGAQGNVVGAAQAVFLSRLVTLPVLAWVTVRSVYAPR